MMAAWSSRAGCPPSRVLSSLRPWKWRWKRALLELARRADALAEVAETYMNSEPVPNATADRYQVVVHVVGAASAATDTPAETAHIENGPHVSAETSRRIACDCSVLGIREDEDSEPLSIG